MLKFLTHKLRTHSLNEDNFIEKVRKNWIKVNCTRVTPLKVTTK